ncbi:MAG: hypothetical protein AVDCRST_MAG02-3496 [uncultured Rubrobacteraceae bacterium]|uniref:Uncharacterized protein n=1 Tax=uncultured Rubrobacteraceae bacterium TaxID=349277 RepID=A0A6J4R5Q4_9ACTN|nr:MAG: hypothetical protein AVDCRST_MAG02-3496 [uncultured Rubrobacteraceae bacterium]
MGKAKAGTQTSRPPVLLTALLYFRRPFALFTAFFSGDPPDFLPFLPPAGLLPPAAFLICFSIPAISAVTLLL